MGCKVKFPSADAAEKCKGELEQKNSDLTIRVVVNTNNKRSKINILDDSLDSYMTKKRKMEDSGEKNASWDNSTSTWGAAGAGGKDGYNHQGQHQSWGGNDWSSDWSSNDWWGTSSGQNQQWGNKNTGSVNIKGKGSGGGG